ncbi:MAG: hypothetical protein RMK40_05210 [Chloroflexota bacterium]|nr:hypothetical protein [Chloroflexota bacterium]
MPLDELLQVISRLRERAQQHQVRLGASEAQTRYSLIDPLLRALGWDTEDPTQVRVEESTGAGTADYALLDASGKAHMYLEAKRLGRPLSDGLAQGINHCLTQGTLYFVVTDGLRWEIYETHKPVPLEQKRVVAWDIGREDPAEVAKKARTLWRPNILRQTASAPVESSTVTPTTAPLLLHPLFPQLIGSRWINFK